MELEIRFRGGNPRQATTVLGPGEYVIGRDPACEVIVAGGAVSRRHARVTVGDFDFFIEDLGSANGTYVDGKLIKGRVPVEAGQSVSIGYVEIEFTPRDTDGSATAAGMAGGAEATSSDEYLAGKKYAVSDVIAVGGMGTILRAHDLRIRRPVAMKLMPEDEVQSPRRLWRFVREAQVTGQLEHPNIVPVYDLGIDAQGRPFYTMKYVRGITLKTIVDDIRAGNQDTITQYPLGRLLTIYQKACDAVAFAHSKGVIHRDIKPENIMIGDFGEVIVLDWGLAKRLSSRASEPETDETATDTDTSTDPALRTRDGSVMGTPHFMAPEQAQGSIGAIDERTDIFALGGVLYDLLTLQPPFPGETTAEAMQQVRAGVITPPTTFNTSTTGRQPRRKQSPTPTGPFPHCPGGRIPDSLSAVAMKALAINPAHRYQSVRELQKDIEAYQGGFATRAEQAGVFKLLLLLVRRRRIEFTLGTMTLLALLIVGGVAVARIIASEREASARLDALRAAAPAYRSEAELLIENHQFDEALDRITYALSLKPDSLDFYILRGNILESLLRLAEARDAYQAALQLDPGNVMAQQNIELCTKLLAANPPGKELTPESLNELQAAMLRQQRSAEALAMVRRLGQDKLAVYETWKTILEDEGILTKTSGGARLIIDDTGLMYLNLNRLPVDNIEILREMPLKELQLAQTQVRDLSPLTGKPLRLLNLAGTPVSDIGPLRGMPLKVLALTGCRNLTDITPLEQCSDLELLVLSPQATDIEFLRKLPNLKRLAFGVRAAALKDLPARLGERRGDLLHDRALQSLAQDLKHAADFWREYDAKQKKK